MSQKFSARARNRGRAQMDAPKHGGAALRTFVLALFAALLPPVGVLTAWRAKGLPVLARVALSALAFLSMSVALTLLMRGGEAATILPAPVVPEQAGYVAPTPVPAPADAAAPTDNPASSANPANPADSAPPEEAATPAPTATPEPATVYAVTGNATYYHATDSCDGQVNRRVLTLEEAKAEGLEPCEKCYPPGN